MPATRAQARDQACLLLQAAVDASTHPELVLLWMDTDPSPAPPFQPTPWARVRMLHASGGQTSLSDDRGRKRYTRRGVIVVQLFTPAGQGLGVNDQIDPIILGAYEGKTTSGGLVFRNGRSQEVGVDGPWFQTNVFVDFEYDEIK